MDQKPTTSIKDDVLHSTDHVRLTPEEIAKAVAHHNRHHPKDKAEMSSRQGAGKSPGGGKMGK